MKIGIFYWATASVMQRLRDTLAIQSRILPQWKDLFRPLFILDHQVPLSPDLPGDVIRASILDSEGRILPSAAKNIGATWARDEMLDWLIDCDVDTVITVPPFEFPSSGVSHIPCYFSEEGDSPETAIEKWRKGRAAVLAPSSRFFLRRDIFSKYSHHLGFVGYGYEDLDYWYNVISGDRLNAPCGGEGIHFWHPRRGKLSEQNKALYEQRRVELHSRGGSSLQDP